jgi:hypothetical protein
MFLSDKFGALAYLNAEHLGLCCTANLTLSIFSGVQAVCPLPGNESLTLHVVVNLLNELKKLFHKGS